MKIPSNVSSIKMTKFLVEKGFTPTHYTGDHIVFDNNMFVPSRSKLPIGTICTTLKQFDISRKDFINWWYKL